MKILDFFALTDKSAWAGKIGKCDWKAAEFLADLLRNGKFHELLGNGSLYILADGESLVSFCTLTERDCIDDRTLYPWIGFVFTAPDYRGKRCSGEVISYALRKAEEQGYDTVYLATDHIGLYERYGFSYMESRTDIYGEESRIYRIELPVILSDGE